MNKYIDFKLSGDRVKTITMEEYNKKMDKILNNPNLEVHEKLMLSMEEAAKYRIEETDCKGCKKQCKWERQSVWTCFDYEPKRGVSQNSQTKTRGIAKKSRPKEV